MYKLSVPRSVQLCGYDLHCSRLNIAFKFSVLLDCEYRFDMVEHNMNVILNQIFFFLLFSLKNSAIIVKSNTYTCCTGTKSIEVNVSYEVLLVIENISGFSFYFERSNKKRYRSEYTGYL